MEKKIFVVKEDVDVEKFLLSQKISFSALKMAIRKGDIKLNGVKLLKAQMAKKGDNVEIFLKDNQTKKIKILFEDENVCVLVKPSHIQSTGEGGVEGVLGLRAVHRLDTNTQGLMIFAKTEVAKVELEKVFKNGFVHKFYVCEVCGDSNFDGEYSAFLFKDEKKSKVSVSNKKTSKNVQIITRFKTVKHGNKTSMVVCELLTGKTHQIRAHLAHLGHPILGDSKYGNFELNKLLHEKTQKLFCFALKFDKLEGEVLSGVSDKTFENRPEWYKDNGE